jgi:hypothetical protein
MVTDIFFAVLCLLAPLSGSLLQSTILVRGPRRICYFFACFLYILADEPSETFEWWYVDIITVSDNKHAYISRTVEDRTRVHVTFLVGNGLRNYDLEALT